mmetsp:Transcript_103366/g.291844  ORF Transcript_103366/g.291844 Transcript_103366/m.291844 type:complete len:245 (+) Transcript_103366:906-1640(+)
MAFRRSPPQSFAMKPQDSGMAFNPSRFASVSSTRATSLGSGATCTRWRCFCVHTLSSAASVASPQMKTMGHVGARITIVSLSFRPWAGSSGTSKTNISVPTAPWPCVLCRFMTLSKPFKPSKSVKLCSTTTLPMLCPTWRTPALLPLPGRPTTTATRSTSSLRDSTRCQFCNQAPKRDQANCGTNSLTDSGSWRSHHGSQLQAKCHGDERSKRPWPAWRNARVSAFRGPRVRALNDLAKSVGAS